MKRQIACGLLLAAVLGLSGCTGWDSGSYVSVTLHQEPRQPGLSDSMSVTSVQELQSAVVQLLDKHSETGTILLEYCDADQAEDDLAKVQNSILTGNPLYAYAVSNIDAAVSSNPVSVTLTIEYARTRQEIEDILDQMYQAPKEGLDAVRDKLISALKDMDSTVTLWMKNPPSVEDFRQFVSDYAELHPDQVMETPLVTMRCYPEHGELQIVELNFPYHYRRVTLQSYQTLVNFEYQQAEEAIRAQETETDQINALYAYIAGHNTDTTPSLTPAYSLLHDKVGDIKAVTLSFAAIGRQAGLEICSVVGSKDGEAWHWNICTLDGVNYHVDVFQSIRDGKELSFRFDDEMEGYVWDHSNYPACAQPEPPEETAPVQPAYVPPVNVPPEQPEDTAPTVPEEPSEPVTEPTEASIQEP